MGVTANDRSQRPLEIKKNEALEYERPRDMSELKRFLGLTGWFREFIRDYVRLTENLTNSLRMNRNRAWNERMEYDFRVAKEVVRRAKELKLP